MKNVTYISASAGSGKTYELTECLKDVVLSGKAKPEEVILTTFTNASASDFKEKAKAKFYEVGKTQEANRLDQALIGTIDSVANVFVKKYWYLLGMSPRLNVLSKEDEAVFVSESLSHLPTDEQSAFFYKFAEILKIPEVSDNFAKTGIDYAFWGKDLKSIFNFSRNYAITDYSDCIRASKELIQSLCVKGLKLTFNKDDLLNKLDAIDAISLADKKSAARDTRILETKKFRKIVVAEGKSSIEIGLALIEMIAKGKFTSNIYKNNSDYLALVRKSEDVWICEDICQLQLDYIDNLFEISSRWKNEYIKYKKEMHVLDYTDMEHYFLELITNEKYTCVQDDIKKGYKYLFVDEFQDCSPTQIKIFDRLSELVNHSIWVGDYKQAIYGFRGSDTALVKAVTDKISKMNGKPNKTLDVSHRSWPDIVNVNNAVFVPAFRGILTSAEVSLKPWDKLIKESKSSGKENLLKCWLVESENSRSNKQIFQQVADNIAQMIINGVAPKDIAVLARKNTVLTTLATYLKGYNIPVLVGDSEFQSSSETLLLNSLLSLVVNPDDSMARATIAFLTENGYDASKLLDERFDAIAKGKRDCEYLEDIGLIKKVMRKRDDYKNMSVGALVESMIIEMDLYNVVKLFSNSDNCVNSFHTLIDMARTYENRCIQMGLPSTVYGFIDYVSSAKECASGLSEGVQLFTYHGSKGLEWKNVVLLSLDDDFLDDDVLISRDFYGTHFYHEMEPTVNNFYLPMTISVVPWIFGLKTNVPDVVKKVICSCAHYEKIKKTKIQEEKRLMYVAMTRPVESLILVFNKKNGFLRLKEMGLNVADSIPNQGKYDILGVGDNLSFTIQQPFNVGEWKFTLPEKKIVNIASQKVKRQKRDMQPSKCKSSKYASAKDVPIGLLCDFDKRITLKDAKEKDKIGTCFHNIFCVLEKNPRVETVQKIIHDQGLETVIPNPSEVLDAWQNLENFLTKNYGPKVVTYHELPFKHMFDGQIFTGSIDLLWETASGVVLVDYKSYAENKADVLNPSHEHYAGMYAGQFECYEKALKAAEKNILDKVIYYHVLGVCVKFK